MVSAGPKSLLSTGRYLPIIFHSHKTDPGCGTARRSGLASCQPNGARLVVRRWELDASKASLRSGLFRNRSVLLTSFFVGYFSRLSFFFGIFGQPSKYNELS
jgi:hypothetical protein